MASRHSLLLTSANFRKLTAKHPQNFHFIAEGGNTWNYSTLYACGVLGSTLSLSPLNLSNSILCGTLRSGDALGGYNIKLTELKTSPLTS